MSSDLNPNREFWDGTAVVVTGGAGFLGKSVVRLFEGLGARVSVPRSDEFDLTQANAADEALLGAQVVIHLAANVGGIGFNYRNPAPLVHDNLAMGLNVFEAARKVGVKRLVCAGTACAYPKDVDAPLREEHIWDGYPEETNAPYGLAKRMMTVLSDTYRRQYGLDSCVPILANLYGPGDNFDSEDSHVITAMIHKYVAAQELKYDEVVLWGTGSPTREFLYVDDAARAVVLSAELEAGPVSFNIGTGIETRIKDVAAMVSTAVGYEGTTTWDVSRPDGQPARYFDLSRAVETVGFKARVPLEQGIVRTVKSLRENQVATDRS